jgi:redox-sensing transcriptional repressor
MIGSVSTQTLQRLPLYLRYLKALPRDGRMNISAKAIAEALGLGEIQVRKDLAAISSGGRPKIGYITESLMADIQSFLGCDNINEAVLVGAGKLGRALLAYEGFGEYGLNIVAAFDDDEGVIEDGGNGKPVFSMGKLEELCARMKIHIGIITVPADSAQSVCDRLLDAGVLAIWNFASVHLKTPEHILVKNENIADSLALLSKRLAERLYE